jgi:hypothetical protein
VPATDEATAGIAVFYRRGLILSSIIFSKTSNTSHSIANTIAIAVISRSPIAIPYISRLGTIIT